jgi:GST-like protein
METKRQYDVLDRHLSEHRFMAGDEYSIADMAIWPWYGNVALGQAYDDATTFLGLNEYRHFNRWVDEVGARPGVQRGRRVNRKAENDPTFIRERHNAADLD